MRSYWQLPGICGAIFLMSWAGFSTSAAAQEDGPQCSGDFRARYEADVRTKRDSSTGELTEDEERSRFRYRARLAVKAQVNPMVDVGMRFSSGDTRDANSPHVVIGSDNNSDNETPNDDREGNFGFSRDPFTIDPAHLGEIKPVLTMVGGKVVYERE